MKIYYRLKSAPAIPLREWMDYLVVDGRIYISWTTAQATGSISKIDVNDYIEI